MIPDDSNNEGRLLPATRDRWRPIAEGVIEVTKLGGEPRLLMHISGPTAPLPPPNADRACYLRIVTDASGWLNLIACMNDDAAGDNLLLMLDTPDPDPDLRRQLTKDVNRGVTLPSIIFASTSPELPVWISQFAVQLADRGHRVCTIYVGDP
uniref:RC154 n=1 Tax=Ruegeria sp. PR1b TaxID=185588 RepID=Q8KW36_9RHOB|nr:hypothetical protein [Ruegeria sp. PR1b]AAN05227.1 RC154 [Ruegeria sp. PR1b]